MNPSDIRELFASIKACHQGFDDGRAAQAVWIKSMEIGRVDSLDDAQEAVATYFVERPATCNDWPWIKPADVVSGVRAIRSKRLAGVDTTVPDVDPDDVAAYLEALRQATKRRAEPQREDRPARREVGRVERRAIAAGPDATAPASAAHIAALRRSISRALPLRVPGVDAAREGQERPGGQVFATRPVSEAQARRIDAARVRQAAGLDALVEREEAR